MKIFSYCSFSLLCWVLSSPLAMSADLASHHEPSFFLDKARGWFWYEQAPEPTKPKKKPPSRKAAPANPSPKNQISGTPKPVPLSSAWFRKELSVYRDRAIDDPTLENVATYYYLQRVMLDKAQRFTDAARYVVMSDPQLDENTRRPIATYAANEANQWASSASEQALNTIAQTAGLLFFFRSDCRYCHVQAPILTLLQQRFGFHIYAVSLDGKPMPNGLFGDFHQDLGQAQQLGVISTPAIFLMYPPHKIVPITQSAVSLDELVGRILLAANEIGVIGEAVYQATRGQQPNQLMIPPTHAVSPQMLDNPNQLINVLRRYSRPNIGTSGSISYEGRP